MARKWYDEFDETLRDLQDMAEEGICDDTAYFNGGIDRDGFLSPSDINESETCQERIAL